MDVLGGGGNGTLALSLLVRTTGLNSNCLVGEMNISVQHLILTQIGLILAYKQITLD